MTEEHNENPDPDVSDASEEENGTENEQEEPAGPATVKLPGLTRNYISFVGIAISFAAIVGITLLFLLEITGSASQHYLGILIYILFPGILIFGLFVVVVGMFFERRRRRKVSAAQIAEYPILDLNDPRRRRSLAVLVSFLFVFLFVSAFGSYQAFEFTESVTFCGQICHEVMKPEFLSYNASPHARVRCVDCHVGGGAEWYARSKFSGVRQLVKVTFGTYDKPIHTPVDNMRPARDTCAKCHWPEKFHGEKLRVFNDYGYDEKNTPSITKMLVRVGGGSPETGQVSGIHWHMNLANKITYIATDEQRQVIPWVRLVDSKGKATVYTATNSKLSRQQIEVAAKKQMNCIDCHSRPAHKYLSPNNAVDKSILANKLDRSLPFLKRTSVDVLTKKYETTDQALNEIAMDFRRFYRTNYAETYSVKKKSIDSAVFELQRIYRTYFFPEMKTDWQTHPDNIGHFNTQGCFRCHDGRHVSPEGKVVRNECNVCHVTFEQTYLGNPVEPVDGRFQHPIDLGERGNNNCAACHKGDRSFKHPVNLGDISRFSCSECHKKEGF